MKTKFQHILPTYFIIFLSILIGLIFVRFLSSIAFNMIDIDESYWELWFPLSIPAIIVLFFFRHKFKILLFKKNNTEKQNAIIAIAILSMAAPIIISQHLLTTATGKVLSLENPEQILDYDQERYYTLNEYKVGEEYRVSHTDIRTSGKHNDKLNFTIYFVFPLYQREITHHNLNPNIWYGIEFHERISNYLSSTEKDAELETFYNECLRKLESYNFYDVGYFENVPTSGDLDYYQQAVENLLNTTTKIDSIILIPKIGDPSERNGNKLIWILGSFLIGFPIFLLALSFSKINEKELERQKSGKKPSLDSTSEMFHYLIPKGKNFSTALIIDLNILVFIVMVITGIHLVSPTGSELLKWGANRRMEVLNGEWWRLFTSMFLHAGIMHLFLNISALLIASFFVERTLNRFQFLFIYIFSGLLGSISSIWWYENTVSCGASGAIFGIFGAILGMTLMKKNIPKFDRSGVFFIVFLVGINLLWGLIGNIDNAGHIGGLIGGFILGPIVYLFANSLKSKN